MSPPERPKMVTAQPSFPRRGRTPSWHALAAVGLLVALAGCKTTNNTSAEIVGAVPDDYRRNHPIAINELIDTMDVPVGINSGKLPAGFSANIQGFAQKFLASGSQTIAIVAPSGSANETPATYISYQIRDVLVASGVPRKAIDMRVYKAASGENGAPVRIAFARIAAQTAGCGPWPDQLGNNAENRNYHNFGCATQQNMAAIVANPLDLLYPRGMTPPDAARRAAVLQKYEQGQVYQSDYSREPAGQIAEGVGQ